MFKAVKTPLLLALPVYIVLSSVTPCAAQHLLPVIPGTTRGSATVTLPELNGVSEGSIFFVGEAGRSYCCEVRYGPSETSDFPYFTGSVLNYTTNESIPYKERGLDEPVIPNFSNHPYPADSRRCIHTLSKASYLMGVHLGTPTNNFLSAQLVECIETTLFGGYNTNVTDFNFLELTNLLKGDFNNQAITTVIAITDLFGNLVVPEKLQVVRPGFRTDIDIHSIVGAGKYGTIRIAHDGPPGALKAALTQYRITSTVPLDFVPVAREVFTVR